MLTQTVHMYELTTHPVGGLIAVKFRRYHNDALAILHCRPQDVLAHHPLKVRLTIPPGARISDMHEFEGKEVFAQPVGVPRQLTNGE